MTTASASDYVRPASLAEALGALARPGTQILSGGTDFYPALGDRPANGAIVDISAIRELSGIAIGPSEVRIGARTTWTEIIRSPLPRAFDALKAAAREVGGIQIQNTGTVAGNLCNASPAADGVPPLLALDAEVEIRAAGAPPRRVPLSRFIVDYRKTALRPGEMVSAIVVPRTIEGPSAFVKLGARRYLVISIAMVAAIIEKGGDGRIAKARIAVGSCSAVARRMPEAEAALIGAPAELGVSRRITDRELIDLTPIDDVRATAAYRGDAGLTLIRRAVESCVEEFAR
ncbi:MAG: FAD binding domain-containing protein [Hyphomicrobiales bacterium]